MLNKEKFKNEIFEIACNGSMIALKNGKPVPCVDTSCDECELGYIDCANNCREWANSEYIEPPVDWSKVPVDTPILVRDSELAEWVKAHFAKVTKDGTVYSWMVGKTSWTGQGMCSWKFAKLAESEG